jgi:hypothetical protein
VPPLQVPVEAYVRRVVPLAQVGPGGVLQAVFIDGYVQAPPPQVPGAL